VDGIQPYYDIASSRHKSKHGHTARRTGAMFMGANSIHGTHGIHEWKMSTGTDWDPKILMPHIARLYYLKGSLDLLSVALRSHVFVRANNNDEIMSVEAIKAMLTEERIIEAVETDSHYHEIQDHDVPVRRQHSSREATLRTGTADSLPHRGSSGTLGPNFRLNAPAPDDGEDDVHVDPPPNSEPSEGQTRHVSMASDDEPRLNAPASDGVALVVSTPDEDVVSTPDEEIRQLNHFEMAQVDMSHKPDWAIGRRRWKVEWLTIASLSTLLLAAIIVIIVLALNQSTSSETKAATKPPVVPTNPSVPKTLDLIKARGILACGVVPYAGFSMLDNSTGSWSGFEIDLVSF
jgi:hypothetical protein